MATRTVRHPDEPKTDFLITVGDWDPAARKYRVNLHSRFCDGALQSDGHVWVDPPGFGLDGYPLPPTRETLDTSQWRFFGHDEVTLVREYIPTLEDYEVDPLKIAQV